MSNSSVIKMLRKNSAKTFTSVRVGTKSVRIPVLFINPSLPMLRKAVEKHGCTVRERNDKVSLDNRRVYCGGLEAVKAFDAVLVVG